MPCLMRISVSGAAEIRKLIELVTFSIYQNSELHDRNEKDNDEFPQSIFGMNQSMNGDGVYIAQ